MSSTLIAFAPGELTTIDGPYINTGSEFQTKSFNFNDLPCPPQNIMVITKGLFRWGFS